MNHAAELAHTHYSLGSKAASHEICSMSDLLYSMTDNSHWHKCIWSYYYCALTTFDRMLPAALLELSIKRETELADSVLYCNVWLLI